MTAIEAIRLSMQRDIDILREQIPVLEHIELDGTLPNALRMAAGGNLEDSQENLGDLQVLIRQVQDWTRKAQSLRDLIRRPEQFQMDQNLRELGYQNLSEEQERIEYVRSFLRNLHLVTSNTNLLDQHQLLRRASTTTAASTTTDSGMALPPNLAQSQMTSGLGSVSAASDRHPTADLRSYTDGYYATPARQAALFSEGWWIGGNTHHRRRYFVAGGHADIQSHVPIGTTSTESDSYVGGAAAIGFAGGFAGGPVWGVLVAIGVALTAHALRLNDAANQDYTIHFFANSNASTPWGTRTFRGNAHSSDPGTALQINGNTDPSHFPDFADQWRLYEWSTPPWFSGTSPARAASIRQTASHPTPQQSADTLVQMLSHYAASSSVSRESGWTSGLVSDTLTLATTVAL